MNRSSPDTGQQEGILEAVKKELPEIQNENSDNQKTKKARPRTRKKVSKEEDTPETDKTIWFKTGRICKGLTLKEFLRKTQLERLISGKAKEKEKGISTEQTISFQQMSPDGICMVKEGYYTLMIELADANYKIRDRNERLAMLDQYAQILNSFDPSICFQLFLFSRHSDSRDLADKFNVPLRGDGHDFLREEYTGLLKSLCEKSTSGITKGRYLIIGMEAENLKQARFRLEERAKEIIGDFDEMGSSARILDGTERLKLLYEFYNQDKPEGFDFSYEAMRESGDSVKDYIAPKKMDFSKAGILKTDREYVSTGYVDLDCAKLNETLMESLSEIDECFSVSIHMQTIEPEKAMKITRRSLTDIQSSKINQQKKAFDGGYDNDVISNSIVQMENNANEILRNLNESNQKLIRTTFLITAFGRTKRELEAIHERVFSKFKAIGCRSFDLKHTQEQALNAAAPIGINTLDQKRIMLTKDAAIFIPFRTWELSQGGDFIYYGVNNLSRNLILGDRKQLQNPNGLIVGIPGSGKSFSAKREILGTYTCTKDDIIICDPEGEYFPLVTALGGTVVKLSTTSNDYLNPMDINYSHKFDREELKTKSDFILTLCDCIAGGNLGLESDERGIIDSCLNVVYEKFFNDPKPENMPILEDLYNALVDYTPNYTVAEELTVAARKKALHIANSLVLYVHGSQNYFNHRTNVDSNNRIICFDIRDLGRQLKELGMLIVQDAVWNRVSRNREQKVATRYYCDEFHLLLREGQTAKYSAEIWKRFRKWGGIPTGITQNVRDFLLSGEVENILSTSEFLYILKQSPSDRDLLMEKLKLSATEMEYVLNAGKGCGILRFGDNEKKIVFEDDYPKDTKSYEMMNTRLNTEAEDEEISLLTDGGNDGQFE